MIVLYYPSPYKQKLLSKGICNLQANDSIVVGTPDSNMSFLIIELLKTFKYTNKNIF